ncbi:helix-turn-helix transcriptional regulator [Hydrogenophaga sp.]|uniref:helix-turn-helix transcriptional regulator n=1 Tax=Hydrogenophaga sp. TaxID=1904254 RepID=UPI003F6FB29F
MNDFASEAMLRLVRTGLKRQGLATDGPPPVRQAHVPLADKRAWLHRLWQAHGPDVIVRLGEAVHRMDDEPLLLALSLARDPADLLQRWQRLERFVHSRHRMRVDQPEPGWLRIRHVSLDPHLPPTPAEDLLVFGFLVAMCERLETPGVRARPEALTGWSRSQRAWRSHAWPDDVSAWELRWQTASVNPVADVPPADPDGWIAHLQARLAADPGRSWTVQSLALAAASSPRTLQRRLALRDLTFTQLLSDARLISAARLLAVSPMPTAEVGYVCGFADQAHFTRQFKHHTAMTPGLYRNAFALRAGV